MNDFTLNFQNSAMIYSRVLSIRKVIFCSIIVASLYVFYKYRSVKSIYPIPFDPAGLTVSINVHYHLPEEIDFPLAFGLSVYRDPHQFWILFNAIYKPFHVYCIHVDLKSPKPIHDFVRNLSRTFPNVVLPKVFINVQHGKFSVLESELLCMDALLQQKIVKWKYFINLTGQEWPLKTNLELIRILKSLKGANLMEKIRINADRVPAHIGPPPHGIKLWKGAVHIIATREFVRFALQNRRALDLLDYLRQTLIPDETYFSTLNHDHSLKAPGGYSGDLLSNPISYPYLNRYKLWETEHVCYGKFVRGICVFGMADVPEMIDLSNMKLFANKFIMDINPDVFDHMCSWFRKRNEIVYSKPSINPLINLTYYSQLTVVKNHF